MFIKPIVLESESVPIKPPELLLDTYILLLNSFSWELCFSLLAILLLIVGSALVSGSEVAYFSLNTQQLSTLKEKPVGNSLRILRLLERPRFLLATILIANNLFNIGLILTCFYVSGQLLGETLPAWQNFLVNIVLITFILVLFGEIIPKVYANQYNLQLAKITATPLNIMRKLFYPLSAVLISSTRFIEDTMGSKIQEIDLQELDKAIEKVAEDEQHSKEEVNMLKGIVNFGNIMVKEIMRARVDVVAINSIASYSDLKNTILSSGYSRIPVYKETFDNIIGLVYAKDLLTLSKVGAKYDWAEIIKKPYIVPENKKIDDLLKEFQSKRMHMAIVVDEYGGTSGVVTLEDILEEVVGEINDEYDKELELPYKQLDDRNFVFDGKTLLRDVFRILNVDEEAFIEASGESDSIGGLLLELNGNFPDENEQLQHHNCLFTVLSLHENRIENVQITILDEGYQAQEV